MRDRGDSRGPSALPYHVRHAARRYGLRAARVGVEQGDFHTHRHLQVSVRPKPAGRLAASD
jgi:hypothetical protein